MPSGQPGDPEGRRASFDVTETMHRDPTKKRMNLVRHAAADGVLRAFSAALARELVGGGVPPGVGVG